MINPAQTFKQNRAGRSGPGDLPIAKRNKVLISRGR